MVRDYCLSAYQSFLVWSPRNTWIRRTYTPGRSPPKVLIGELEDWPALELTMRQNNVATALARSPNGHLLATPDGSDVRVWDALGTGVSQLFEGHTGEVTSVAFSPDGTSLVSGSKDCTVRLWNLATGTSEVVIRHTGDRKSVV